MVFRSQLPLLQWRFSAATYLKGRSTFMINSQKNAEPLTFPLPTSVPDSPKVRVGKVHTTRTIFSAMVLRTREGRQKYPSRPQTPAASRPPPLSPARRPGKPRGSRWESSRPPRQAIDGQVTRRCGPPRSSAGPRASPPRSARGEAGWAGEVGGGPPVRRLPGCSSGPFRRAAPGAGEAGLGAAAPRRPGWPGAPPHARTGGTSPPRFARRADRTHLASLTPTPTPSAPAQEEAAVPGPGRRLRLHLGPGEPGADGGR